MLRQTIAVIVLAFTAILSTCGCVAYAEPVVYSDVVECSVVTEDGECYRDEVVGDHVDRVYFYWQVHHGWRYHYRLRHR